MCDKSTEKKEKTEKTEKKEVESLREAVAKLSVSTPAATVASGVTDCFKCPHCNEFVLVHKNEIGCGIFRHGVFISNGTGVNPHLPQIECERLVNANLVYGCCKPFRYDGKQASVCDYI